MKYMRLFFLCFVLKFVTCTLDAFITGGSFVGINKYPHSVYLDVTCDHRFMCGGSILNQEVILTAAHCLEDCHGVRSNNIIVKYGHEKLSKMKSTPMKNFAQHQKYDERAIVNDIALITTRERIPLTKRVQRVIVMKRPPVKRHAYVAGWGIDEKHNSPKALKHTFARVQKLDVCKKMGYVANGDFCAGPLTGIGAADQGDSGSALIIDEYIQIGLVSYKVEKYSLVAYTNVSLHVDWITSNAKSLVCGKG